MSEREAASVEEAQVETPAESARADQLADPAQAGGPTSALFAWTDAGEAWRLRLVLPDALIPAEAELRDGEDVFADVNGITDRRDVPGGVMTRSVAASAGKGTGTPTGEATGAPAGERIQGERSIELVVPRGFRGSLQFLPVPHALDAADRPTWLDALERAFLPTGQHGLREVVDMRTQRTFELAAPDARPLIWTGEAESGTKAPVSSGSRPRPGIGSADVSEQVVELDSTARKIWTYRPERAPASAPVLVVFDGESFVHGGLLAGLDELNRPPSVVIAIDHDPIAEAAAGSAEAPGSETAVDLRASDLVMNPQFCDDVLELVRDTAPEASGRTLVAGASYGGLAATYFTLRHPDSFRGISLSPSYWQSDEQGRRIWDFVPDGSGGTGAGGPGESAGRGESAAHGEFCVDHGTLETTIADSVTEAVEEFAARGIDIDPRPFVGGHEHLWWRELILVRLAEILSE
jgi:enterochelin esterase-like enzyme